MEKESLKKTAFAAPYGWKCCYKVMPFRVVNGPATYIIMLYDLEDNWENELLFKFSIKVDNSNNTTIIIDDALDS